MAVLRSHELEQWLEPVQPWLFIISLSLNDNAKKPFNRICLPYVASDHISLFLIIKNVAFYKLAYQSLRIKLSVHGHV